MCMNPMVKKISIVNQELNLIQHMENISWEMERTEHLESPLLQKQLKEELRQASLKLEAFRAEHEEMLAY